MVISFFVKIEYRVQNKLLQQMINYLLRMPCLFLMICFILLFNTDAYSNNTVQESKPQVAICIATTSSALPEIIMSIESNTFNYTIFAIYFNSSADKMPPLQYCSKSIRVHDPSMDRLEYVLYFPNSLTISDHISWQEVVRILDLNALSIMKANKHCNIWQVAYSRELESSSIFYSMRRIILDFLDAIDNYSISLAYHIDQQFEILLSENFSINLNCITGQISDSMLERIWMSLDSNRTNIHFYEQDIRTMYELHSKSPALTKLMGIFSTDESNMGDAAAYFYRSCELSDFRDVATLLEYAYCCHSVDRVNVLASLRRGFQNTEDVRLLHQLFAIHNSNNIHQWEDITMALKVSPSSYDVWLLFIDFALTHEVARKSQNQMAAPTFPTIPASLWIQYLNAGLSFFPSCPALLYLRAMQYFDSGDLPCAARLLSEALLYRNLTSSTFMKSIIADGVVLQNYEWIVNHLYIGQNNRSQPDDGESTWENPTPLPESVYGSCYPLRRITTIGRDPIHEEALRDAVEVLGLSPSQIDCPAITVGGEMQLPSPPPSLEGGCLALQVGCSDHNTCARLPWVVLDAVASLSTWFQSAAYDLRHIRSASVHVLYCSHTLEHLQHYSQENSKVVLALREWNRVLVPGGRLMLAVPDIEAIARIISTQSLNKLQKALMGSIIYGGQDNPYNHHYTAFYMDFLKDLLLLTNFCDVKRVDSLGLFDDNSEINFNNLGSISLNVLAQRCPA